MVLIHVKRAKLVIGERAVGDIIKPETGFAQAAHRHA